MRDGELEAGDRPTRTHDPCELAQRGRGIGDVTEEIRERERIERCVGKRKLLGSPLDELDVLGKPPARFGQHFGALVERDDRAALLPEKLAGDGAGPGGYVEHGVR